MVCSWSSSPTGLVIEVCGIAGWVHDLAADLEIPIQVANPQHEGWRWNKVKRKTDRGDALKLARLAAMNQLPTVYMPDKANPALEERDRLPAHPGRSTDGHQEHNPRPAGRPGLAVCPVRASRAGHQSR